MKGSSLLLCWLWWLWFLAVVCVLKPCEISSCRLWYIGPSIYIYIHAFVHHSPSLLRSCSLSLFRSLARFHTHALSPRSFSPSFCLAQIRSPIAANSRTGRRREGGRVFFSQGAWHIHILQSGACAADWLTWFNWRKQDRNKSVFAWDEQKRMNLVVLVIYERQSVYVTVCNPVWYRLIVLDYSRVLLRIICRGEVRAAVKAPVRAPVCVVRPAVPIRRVTHCL